MTEEWKAQLTVDGDSLVRHLADSPVYASIQAAGELYQHARAIVHDYELQQSEASAATEDTHPQSGIDGIADDLCETLSRLARSPEIRFFKLDAVGMGVHRVVTDSVKSRKGDLFQPQQWTDGEFHAAVTHCLAGQTSLSFSKGYTADDLLSEVVAWMKACVAARPDDATMRVFFGNFLLASGFFKDSMEQLRKAVELDEERCFGTYYTMANIDQNAENAWKLAELDGNDRIAGELVLERCVEHLQRFLDLAPIGHWHTHNVCIALTLFNVCLKACGTESLSSAEKCHPGLALQSLDTFERGVDALNLYEKCFGPETNDFNRLYLRTVNMITCMRREGLLDGRSVPPPFYLCDYPACKEATRSNEPLSNCSKCLAVGYCSRECQRKHYKFHQKECKKIMHVSADQPEVDDKPNVID